MIRFIPLLACAGTFVCLPISAQDTGKLSDGWYRKGGDTDSLYGIDLEGAERLLQNLSSHTCKPVLVAVIDGGFDFTHPELTSRIGTDATGTRHGWNFLGNEAGEDISQAGTAQYREYKRLRPRFKNADTCRMNRRKRKVFARFKQLEQQADADLVLSYKEYAGELCQAYRVCDSLMKIRYGDTSTTMSDFRNLGQSDTTGFGQYAALVAAAPKASRPEKSWAEAFAQQRADYLSACKEAEKLDSCDDPHILLGNDPSCFRNFRYGNDHIGVTPYHGTMVSGIIADCTAVPELKEAIKIIGIRAVPAGDEYDRDVAAAIRYAVDNGARVINMSFVKYLSPDRRKVHKAIRYADRKDVLLVMASGNNGRDVDKTPIYPLCATRSGRRNKTPLVVGSTDRDGKVCGFSNYGSRNVDLFAPGIDIYSTAPDGKYLLANGTSISAPMVTGVAAMIRSLCPDLTAEEVKHILLATVRNISAIRTRFPGPDNDATTCSGNLCRSHGVLNAAAALRLSIQSSKVWQQ